MKNSVFFKTESAQNTELSNELRVLCTVLGRFRDELNYEACKVFIPVPEYFRAIVDKFELDVTQAFSMDIEERFISKLKELGDNIKDQFIQTNELIMLYQTLDKPLSELRKFIREIEPVYIPFRDEVLASKPSSFNYQKLPDKPGASEIIDTFDQLLYTFS